MKALSLAIVLLICTFSSNAQLTHTKWSGQMAIPAITNVTLTFTADSLTLGIDDLGIIGETMSYVVKDSIITMKKLSGNSPCEEVAFTVKYKLKNDLLFITIVKDPCDERKDSWPTEPFKRIRK